MNYPVEFISYSGKFPVACNGDLVLKIEDKEVSFHNILISGGTCSWNRKTGEEICTHGLWEISTEEMRDRYPEYTSYINDIWMVVNANIKPGCCGGCL